MHEPMTQAREHFRLSARMVRVLLAGVGHANLYVIRRAADFRRAGVELVVAALPNPMVYTGMVPGYLMGEYNRKQVSVDVPALCRALGVRFVPCTIASLSPEGPGLTCEDGTTLHGDLMAVNLGAVQNYPGNWEPGEQAFVVKPLRQIWAIEESLRQLPQAARIAVIGGGAAAVELSTTMRAVSRMRGAHWSVELRTRGNLLGRYPKKWQREVRKAITDQGVLVRERQEITALAGQRVTDGSGNSEDYDLVLISTGTRPNPVVAAAPLLHGPRGGMLIRADLTSPSHPAVLGAGDCTDFSPTGNPKESKLPPAGVYPVRQGPLLARNLLSLAAGQATAPYRPQPAILQLLTLGDGRAIGGYPWVLVRGRWVQRWKDFLDKAFVRRFAKYYAGPRQ